MTRIYIAGPMTGLPDFNYPAFNAQAEKLRAQGHHVENPAENIEPPCGTWQGYMRNAIAQLVTCEVICMLPGWTTSRGALIEYRLASDLGLLVTFADLAELTLGKGLGARVVEARSRAGLTQAGLARLLCMAPTQLSRYEKGRRVPHRSTLNRIAAALNVTPAFLSYGTLNTAGNPLPSSEA